jgi:hypothetical protein
MLIKNYTHLMKPKGTHTIWCGERTQSGLALLNGRIMIRYLWRRKFGRYRNLVNICGELACLNTSHFRTFKRSRGRKLTDRQVEEIRWIYSNSPGTTLVMLASRYDTTKQNISLIVNNKNRKDAGKQPVGLVIQKSYV